MAEQEIHAVVDELRANIYCLIEPRHRVRMYRSRGSVDLRREIHTIPSIYDEVYDSLGGMEEGVVGQGEARSVPPLWMDALKWLSEIDFETRALVRRHIGESTDAPATALLRRVATATWRPQDHKKVANYAFQVNQWIKSGERLLAGGSKFGLRNTACPDCGVKHVRHRTAEGWGNTEALQVSVEGAHCLACNRRWDSSMFHHLGAVLGCTAPEDIPITA